MTPELFLETAIKPAMRLLPARMDSSAARAMVLAICLQESALEWRRQMDGGPARSFAQFERAGIVGVLRHHATRAIIARVCEQLVYPADVGACYIAIEHNDVLAAAFARCLLWTLPDSLPGRGQADAAWAQYLEAWRPGKPHPETWGEYYAQAWRLVG